MSERINILYIEDDKIVADTVSRILQLLNQNLFTSYNGLEALEVMQDNQIDIVITDIRMPKLDGINLIEKLRTSGIEVPIVITTAFNEIEYLKKAIEFSVESFIEKPIDLKKLISTITKISQRITIKKELERKKLQIEHFKEAINKSNLIVTTTKDGEITNINYDLFSNLSEEIKKEKISKISSVINNSELEKIYKLINNFEVYNKTINIIFKERKYVVNLTVFASEIEVEDIVSISFMFKDISHVLREKEELINSLYLEPITKLQNKYSLMKDLNEKDNLHKSLVVIDIDNFIRYIKLYGYDIGDKILVKVALKLEDFIKIEKKDKIAVYKLDSDKFAILVKSELEIQKQELEYFATQLSNYLETSTFKIDKTLNLDISFTLGGAYQEDFDIVSEALIAKDVAKEKKLTYIDFSNVHETREFFKSNFEIDKKISEALLNDNVLPYYQVIVDKDKKPIKYEALARVYDKEENKILTPNLFLDKIKNSKYYTKFTKAIIKKALEDEKILENEISINLSYEDVINPEIIEYLENILKEHNSTITIELLESEGLRDMNKTIEFCNFVKNYGAKIAIDDFGNGYSNYEYFLSLPIDILKLDGALVKKVNEYRGYILVESIISFCKKSQIKVVAEYVENEETFNILKNLGIEYFQGYYFSKPKPLDEIKNEKL